MWIVGDLIRRDGVPGIITDVRTSFSAYYHLENGTCGECLNHLLLRETDMVRPRKNPAEKAKAAEAKQTNSLLSAVQFCSGGYKENGETYSTHAMIYGGYLTTYNGVVMYGAKVDTTLQACPHYGLLLAALKATDGDAVQITLVSPERLSIKGKALRTVVPCLADHTLVSRSNPDAPIAPLDSRMRDGFAVMKQITNKSGEYVMESAVMIRSGDMIACDRQMLGCFYHGISFPDVLVPADFIEAVLKIAKPLHSFGYTKDQSLTFYYEDGSFIRTQLYTEAFPDVSKALPTNWDGLLQIPDGFFEALEKIRPFLKKTQGFVLFNDDNVSTDLSDDVGTVVKLPGLREAPSGISLAHLLRLKGHVTHLDYLDEKKMRVRGDNFFGVVAQFGLIDRPEADDADTDAEVAMPTVGEALALFVENAIATGQPVAAIPGPAQAADVASRSYVEQSGQDHGQGRQEVPAFQPPQPVRYDNDPPAPEPAPQPQPQPAAPGGWVIP